MRVLLTGASGYLGGLVASALLRDARIRVVAPVRARRSLDRVLGPIERDRAADGGGPDGWRERLEIVRLPELGDATSLDAAVGADGVDEVIHCAGCLSYFDEAALERGNVELTRTLLERARAWGARRFVYLSTAFSCGHVKGMAPERLHGEPPSDPTPYTRSKRRAENAVAESGLPYLILRPTAVIGDSRTGRYEGPRYGVYQLWTGLVRQLFDVWRKELHHVAPRVPIHVLHQDIFQQAFLAAHRGLADGSVAHLAQPSTVDARDLARLWIDRCMAPERVFYYDRLEHVPLETIDPRLRSFLALTSTNIRISTRRWQFETAALRAVGSAELPRVTAGSIAACQDAFTAGQKRIARFRERYAAHFGRPVEEVEASPSNSIPASGVRRVVSSA